ncbi:unnamed protein product [Pieris brassicae]|uniref:Uncharacterized protein n=1 Tax=Pieris brassicae TaxID=7116 RepID=A0A9P0TZI8_PIEBR|nr:unnamed protein product [Pieris brassicae]
MKTFVFLVVLFVVVAFAASTDDTGESVNTMIKRLPRDTIFVKPPPGCGMPFLECRNRCIRSGHLSGGYCTMTGCVCLR